jgi:ubiquinone/menaquinone biosynthesis C-methylase UbiE
MIVLDRWCILRNLATGKILDVGCNIGEMFGDRATNVDIHSLEDKRKESGNPNLIIPNFVQADANKLPFPDQSYDTVILAEILEHMDDPVATLNEAQRVGKLILISVPNEFQWSEDKKPFTHYDHKTNFDEQKIYDLIKNSGLILIAYYKILYSGWSYFIVQGYSKYATSLS